MPSAPLADVHARVVARLDAGGNYRRWVLLTALAGMFATTFPITVLTVAIPTMAVDFGVSETTLAWVITLPILLSALALPVLGKLGDLYGHRRVFLIGFTLAAVATALSASAWSAALLIFWRTLTAVTGAATQPSSLALINREYPPEERAKAMGWWAMVAAGAPVIGLIVGGPLIEAVGWRALFLVQAIIMVIPVVAAALVLRETPKRVAPFDVAGSTALVLGVGGLMLALSQGTEWGIAHPVVIVSIVIGAAGLWLFAWVESRVEAPLLPLEFLGRRDFTASITVSFFTSASYMGGYFVATLMIINQFGWDVGAAAAILVIRPLVFSVSSPLGGHVAGRIGNRLTAVAGDAVLAVGLATLAVGAAVEVVWIVAVGFVFQGLGHGLVRPPASAALANSVDEANLGIAAASERLLGQLGTAFGITLLTVVYASGSDAASAATAFTVGVALALCGVAAATAMSRRRPAEARAVSGETEPAPAAGVSRSS